MYRAKQLGFCAILEFLTLARNKQNEKFEEFCKDTFMMVTTKEGIKISRAKGENIISLLKKKGEVLTKTKMPTNSEAIGAITRL